MIFSSFLVVGFLLLLIANPRIAAVVTVISGVLLYLLD